MPKFKVVPVDEALIESFYGKRTQFNREYMGYIERLGAGQAGRLEVSEGETVSALRRRLGAAAKAAGKDLIIKRTGETIFFWARGQEASSAPRRRGRPRKTASA